MADQLQYVSASQAAAAMAVVSKGDAVRTFCAPCDETVSKRVPADSLEMGLVWDGDSATPYTSNSGGPYWQLSIDGKAVDLAYVYVPRGQQWENLAMVLGIPVDDVPRVLTKQQIGD